MRDVTLTNILLIAIFVVLVIMLVHGIPTAS